MKINILHEFIDGAWGGGNQFLKGLRNYFISNNVYIDDYHNADVILVNSKDKLDLAYSIKNSFNKKIVHRIDGIFGIYRNDPQLDKLVHNFANQVSDGVIYQSVWSRDRHQERGLNKQEHEVVIYNAANPNIFNTNYDKQHNKKIKLITTSWSPNWGKGFKTLQYLDTNLNFNKYDYEFVGQSPIRFKNIKMTNALPQEELVKKLQNSDIFFTATENDTCSNSLLEALSCGLPTIGFNSGGTPEIISNGGKVYNNLEDILPLVDEVSANIDNFRKNINVDDMETIGKKYLEFIREIL